mmetsp:Transcript_31950/g.77842  ORF Transcript_31950/g.77842 Transcript_31950/m.77842 type:complete len:360 (+) Transcript_31950:111-1190(+)
MAASPSPHVSTTSSSRRPNSRLSSSAEEPRAFALRSLPTPAVPLLLSPPSRRDSIRPLLLPLLALAAATLSCIEFDPASPNAVASRPQFIYTTSSNPPSTSSSILRAHTSQRRRRALAALEAQDANCVTRIPDHWRLRGGKGGAKAPTEDPEKAREALLKAVKKEGGKKGQDLIGMSEMGGMKFFCASLDHPDGQRDLMELSLRHMNKDVNPAMEERVGGAGSVGKMLFSAGIKKLGILANVPKEVLDLGVRADEWLQHVLNETGMNGILNVSDANSTLAYGEVPLDPSINAYPLKVKDSAIPHSIAYLRSKGVFPDRDDESSEIVYGDDDFPDEDEEDEDEELDQLAETAKRIQNLGM